jgi:hypothetical protein
MALRIKATNPQDLLNKIRTAIDQKRVVTWRYINQSNLEYFTHITPDKQWDGKAWFKPAVETDQLLFNIIRPQNSKVSSELYAVYHGRFAEMLLAHFDKEFSIVWAGALAESGDLV